MSIFHWALNKSIFIVSFVRRDQVCEGKGHHIFWLLYEPITSSFIKHRCHNLFRITQWWNLTKYIYSTCICEYVVPVMENTTIVPAWGKPFPKVQELWGQMIGQINSAPEHSVFGRAALFCLFTLEREMWSNVKNVNIWWHGHFELKSFPLVYRFTSHLRVLSVHAPWKIYFMTYSGKKKAWGVSGGGVWTLLLDLSMMWRQTE